MLEKGKRTFFTESVYRINSPQGLDDGNIKLTWDPASDTVTVHRLTIRRGDQLIDVLKSGQTFTTLRRETNLDAGMLDGQLGFIEDHRTVMGFARDAVAGMVDGVRERAGAAVALLGVELPEVPGEIPTLDFPLAQRMIEDATGEHVVGEPDLAPAHERWLGDWARREHASDFVFVTGYPVVKRPFYTHPDPERPELSNSFDLIFRGLELSTGGQRLHRYEDYVAALTERGQSLEPFHGYLQAFRYGMPPHGGWAIGLERWVARLVGATNIRETTLFPRDLNRLTP